METPVVELSSTSSSNAEKFATGDPKHLPPAPAPPPHTAVQEQRGFPLAFAGAIAIVLIVEIALRVTGWPKKIPYALGLDEYYVAAAQLDRHGPAEVAIVGSSRTRESIDVPTLEAQLNNVTGRKNVSVGNYSASGARTVDFEAVVDRLLRDPHPPKIIVIGISERDLAGEPGMLDRAQLYFDWSNLKPLWRQSHLLAIETLPTIVRNEIADYYWTLRYREQIRLRIRQLVTGERNYTSPAAGGRTPWQLEQDHRTLRTKPVAPSDIKRFVHDLHLKRYPDPHLRDALNRICEKCRRSNTQLILYEMPLPTVMLNALPPRAYDKYLREVKRAANANGIQFVRVTSLRIPKGLGDGDFREPSHMGGRGAKRFSKALGHRVIGPALDAIDKKNTPTSDSPTSNRAQSSGAG